MVSGGQFDSAGHALVRRPDADEVPIDGAGDVLVRFDDRDEPIAVEEDSAEWYAGSHEHRCSVAG